MEAVKILGVSADHLEEKRQFLPTKDLFFLSRGQVTLECAFLPYTQQCYVTTVHVL